MNQNLIPTSIPYIYEGHYSNIQIILEHNKDFFNVDLEYKNMVALSPTQPLTIQLNKLKVKCF
jgi:hypothetical protein